MLHIWSILDPRTKDLNLKLKTFNPKQFTLVCHSTWLKILAVHVVPQGAASIGNAAACGEICILKLIFNQELWQTRGNSYLIFKVLEIGYTKQ